MKTSTTISVSGALIAMTQHCGRGLHIGTGTKSMDQGKEDGECVHTEDSVGVVMNTTKGDLSYILNGVNLGVAFCGIPLDKPLVPCVLLEMREILWNLSFSFFQKVSKPITLIQVKQAPCSTFPPLFLTKLYKIHFTIVIWFMKRCRKKKKEGLQWAAS